MTEPRQATPEADAGTPPDPKSWSFWRKRISRALIIGALALTAAQILPSLPEDQVVYLEPPTGVKLTRAQLTYFSKDDGEALAGTELVPLSPAPRLTHTIRVPNGSYLLKIDALGRDNDGNESFFSTSQTVELGGSTARVRLKPSVPGP